MPNSKPFPSKEAELNTYFQAAVPYLIANATRLLISTDNQEKLTDAFNEWNHAFPKSQNSNTRTTTIVKNKDIAKEKLLTIARIIYADVPESVWTTEDRSTLNITEHSTSRTPSPVPTTVPMVKVDTNRRLEHTISFTNEDGTHAKPAGVRGCQIWFKIGEPAIDPSELSFMATDTASPCIHKFAGEDAGKAVYYWLRWENTRGDTGPWSDVIMATITG